MSFGGPSEIYGGQAPSASNPIPLKLGDSASIDAFGRLRTSDPDTVFDSKQIRDLPDFWDDQEVSGTGTSSNYSQPRASTIIGVSNLTAGKRVRQTFMRFNYQPGKSQRALLTFSNIHTSSGNTKGVGIGDDNNGLFFVSEGGVLKFIRRTSITGSPVDNETLVTVSVNSGVFDPTKSLILDIDFEWLGVGRVRAGTITNGEINYFYEGKHSNILDGVYMSTPNLPIRYWIENDGSGEADTFEVICTSVQSEGGQEKLGNLRHNDSGVISGLVSGTTYAAIGMRLKSTNLDTVAILENISAICTTQNDQAHWEIRFNPTVSGTFTYVDEPDSGVQIATGSVANTVTGGTIVDGGFFTTSLPVQPTVPNARRIGSAIDGTPDEIVLCVEAITNNISIDTSITRREKS